MGLNYARLRKLSAREIIIYYRPDGLYVLAQNIKRD